MKILEKIENHFVGIAIIVATTVLFVNIILRYFFNANTTWADEFVRYSMIWIAFIGAAICFRHRIHFGVDLLISSLPERWKMRVQIYINIVCMLFMGLLFYFGSKLVIFSIQTGQITPSLQIGTYLVYMAIPVGAGLSVFHLIVGTINIFNQNHVSSKEEGAEG